MKIQKFTSSMSNGIVPITKEFSRIWLVKKCRDSSLTVNLSSRNQNTNPVISCFKLFSRSRQRQSLYRKTEQISCVVVKSKKLAFLTFSFYDNVSFFKICLFLFLSLKNRAFTHVLFMITISSNRVSSTHL